MNDEPRLRFRIDGGGEPDDAEIAALAVALELIFEPTVEPSEDSVIPTASEWALRGRLDNLHWAPLSQRWPGEPSGQSWRRAST